MISYQVYVKQNVDVLFTFKSEYIIAGLSKPQDFKERQR